RRPPQTEHPRPASPEPAGFLLAPWAGLWFLNPNPSASFLGLRREVKDREAFATVSAHFQPTSRVSGWCWPPRGQRPGASLGINVESMVETMCSWPIFTGRPAFHEPNSLVVSPWSEPRRSLLESGANCAVGGGDR